MLYLLVKYKKPIINSEVSPSFNTFSNITLFLILILIYFVYNNLILLYKGDNTGDKTIWTDKTQFN